MKYAIIGDIHGNHMALKHVLNDAKEQGVDGYLFVGDYCISAPWPAEVVQTLMSLPNAYFVRGNGEDYLTNPEGDDGQFEISRWSKHKLSRNQRDWLEGLPEQLYMEQEGFPIRMAHSSDVFLHKIERKFGPRIFAMKHAEEVLTYPQVLAEVNAALERDHDFWEQEKDLPAGIYIFAHTHIQWHKQTRNHLFINPGACGMPLDCVEFGAPYSILTLENGKAQVEERRVYYDVQELIEAVKHSEQYKAARVWSELISTEWLYGRLHVYFFLEFAFAYADEIGDIRRPLAKDTWEAAFEEWVKK